VPVLLYNMFWSRERGSLRPEQQVVDMNITTFIFVFHMFDNCDIKVYFVFETNSHLNHSIFTSYNLQQILFMRRKQSMVNVGFG
jgi:hypothetical protein